VSAERTEVERVAALARLRLSDAEVDQFTSELHGILVHIDELRTLELVEHSDLTPQLRVPLPSTRHEETESPDLLSILPAEMAPVGRDGFIVVPPPPGLAQSAEG
jgi:aspartyl-tRNA(Asn)/glutamyl-tRNA(Gln) amidotransferase subunit C